MRDATGAVQSALVLGGTSDLAAAVVDLLARQRLRSIWLAARDARAAEARAETLRSEGLDARALPYDASRIEATEEVLAEVGDVDLILLAFGQLGDPYELHASTGDVAALAHVNFVAGVAAAHSSGRHLADQGHGTLVVFSSVAGVRVRATNAIYGATKAGLDGFAQGLADAMHGSGARVMIVRPGFVHTKMTAGLEPAPFATTAEAVAEDVVAGLRRHRRVVWSPSILQGAFAGLTTLPAPLWRRLSR